MGAKGSRVVPYDEALKRVDQAEVASLQAAFRRSFGSALIMPKCVFIGESFGESMPQHLVERIYHVLGGTEKGIHFKDYLCGRVVFRTGTQPERVRFVFDVYDVQGAGWLARDDLENLLASEGHAPSEITALLARFNRDDPKVSFEQFAQWAEAHRDATSLVSWIYNRPSAPQDATVPTLYDTLASVSFFRPSDVQDLERTYYDLLARSPSNRLDSATLEAALSPPIPPAITRALFTLMDDNGDGALDFREFVRGFSECVAAPKERRLSFVFRALDRASEGGLSETSLRKLLEDVALIDDPDGGTGDARRPDRRPRRRAPSIAEAAASCVRAYGDTRGVLTERGFVAWCEANMNSTTSSSSGQNDVPPLTAARIVDALWGAAHVSLGLRPQKASAEGELIRGWIARERMRTPRDGDVWHPVALQWWHTWAAYVDAERKPARPSMSQGQSPPQTNGAATVADDPTPGPIDNSSLMLSEGKGGGIPLLSDCGARLRPGVVENTDYVVVPDRVWGALVGWYGGGPPMPRRFVPMAQQSAVAAATAGEAPVVPLELEMFPMVLSVFRHTPVPASGAPLSADGPKRYMAYTALYSRRGTVRSLLAFLVAQQRRVSGGVMGLTVEDARLHLIRDDGAPPRLLHDEEASLADAGVVDGAKVLLETRSQDLTWPEEMHALARKEQQKREREAAAAKAAAKKEKEARKRGVPPASNGTALAVGAAEDGTTPTAGVSTEALDAGAVLGKESAGLGLTGLSNLGNTCFMNAALQCLSNTSPLREYFLARCHNFEYNLTNKLGMKGHIARLYGELLRDVWSGKARSIAPVKLKAAIGKYASRFDSYQQQDSQELLAFLLDGLHEDLNRVTEKPYTELRDADGRSDDEVSHEWWDNHLRRNRSIVVDLFHGQLRSRLTCSTCGHQSATFDPFTFLTVPLPLETHAYHEVVVFDSSSARPVRYGLRLPMAASVGELREALAALCDIPSAQLVMAEAWGPWVTSYLGRAHKARGAGGGMLAAYRACADNPNEDVYILPTQASSSDASEGQQTRGGNAQSSGLGKLLSGLGRRLGGGVVDMLLGRRGDKDRAGTGQYTPGYRAPPPPPGCVVVYCRRPKRSELDYVFSARPSLFGVSLVMSPISPTSGRRLTRREFYEEVWRRHSRLFDAKAREEWDAKVTQGVFPFVLRWTDAGGLLCGTCSWERFCTGCLMPCDDVALELPKEDESSAGGAFVAVDWEPPLLHLHYDSEGERTVTEHASVLAIRAEQREAISLEECLASFTREEELGDEELWRCSKCKDFRKATKKMEIWRLPQILIIHLKRFQYVSGRWIKSQKMIRFPAEGLDPSRFVVGPESPFYVPAPKPCVEGGSEAAAQDMASASKAPDADSPAAVANGGPAAEACDATTSAAAREPHADPSANGRPCASADSSLSGGSLGTVAVANDAHPARAPLFDLYAVTSHVGVMGGGHYVCYARNANQKWYCFNDSKCEELKGGGDDIPTASAYVLFYERQGLDAKALLPRFDANAKEIALDPADDATAGGRRRDVCCTM